jgi:DNA-binding response OmpR family regulator
VAVAPVSRLRFGVDEIWLDDVRLELTGQERAILRALSSRRVLSRAQLARAAQLEGGSDRRCDSVLVGLRRALPPGAIRNVRARGWMLELETVHEADDRAQEAARSDHGGGEAG